MKTVKAWAVVDKDGTPIFAPAGNLLAANSEDCAKEMYRIARGQRVVRVTIQVEDE